MLEHLRRIIEGVNATRDLPEAMSVVVHLVKKFVSTQACSIYLYSPQDKKYFLTASEGFKNDGQFALAIPQDAGLVGLVGKREEPLNLENAREHPAYLYFPETGEEQYCAFLGAPIIHQRRVLGVLVIQQIEARRFDEEEEAFIVTVCAQLAATIAHADLETVLCRNDSKSRRTSKKQRSLIGIPVAPGIGIGQAVVIYPHSDLDAVPSQSADNIEEELDHFRQSLIAVREELDDMRKSLSTVLKKDELLLFEAYKHMLDHTSLGGEVERIIQEGLSAQSALKNVVKKQVLAFYDMTDEYMRDRATDVKDLGHRVLRHLQKAERGNQHFPTNTILVGEEVTASLLAEVPSDHLLGIVSMQGSKNSHVAILARALGIPVITGVEGFSLQHIDGQLLVIDGYNGRIYVAPHLRVRRQYERLMAEKKALHERLTELQDKPSETLDGVPIALYVNTGLLTEVPCLSEEETAAGVGLYRTEMPFLLRERFPSEEEQRQLYEMVLARYAPRPVTMRTLDIGGDKMLSYFPINEPNPYLGWRGVRVTLDHPELFLVQVRAMLRAAVGLDNLRIMLPMVSSIGEIDESLRLIKQAYNEMIEEGLTLKMPLIGVMVEIPALAFQLHTFADRIGFISIGTNDLVQYLLAVDRNNERVANLYDALHPAVIQVLQMIIQKAAAARLSVTVCGEMATDPASVLILIALGVQAVSINSTSLLTVKWIIRSFSKSQTENLLQQVLQLHHAVDIRRFLEQALVDAGLGGLIRAGN